MFIKNRKYILTKSLRQNYYIPTADRLCGRYETYLVQSAALTHSSKPYIFTLNVPVKNILI